MQITSAVKLLIVLVQSISSFIYFYYFITFHCISLAVEGDQTTTDPYIFQLAWDLYNQGAIQSSYIALKHLLNLCNSFFDQTKHFFALSMIVPGAWFSKVAVTFWARNYKYSNRNIKNKSAAPG